MTQNMILSVAADAQLDAKDLQSIFAQEKLKHAHKRIKNMEIFIRTQLISALNG
jgi:hypothetical protein